MDDSAVIRRVLRETFERETDFEVEVARDGTDALARIGSFRPDVVTLDVAMPGMDGLAVLRALPAPHGCAVVIEGHRHMVNLTAPQAVSEALQSWLSTTEIAA